MEQVQEEVRICSATRVTRRLNWDIVVLEVVLFRSETVADGEALDNGEVLVQLCMGKGLCN